jgi:hypothetical protein
MNTTLSRSRRVAPPSPVDRDRGCPVARLPTRDDAIDGRRVAQRHGRLDESWRCRSKAASRSVRETAGSKDPPHRSVGLVSKMNSR